MKQLSKRFGKSESNVLNDFNLQVEAQEFIVIVGPSGCGKSTLLRMIAGLEEITAGELLMDGKCVNTQASNERDIAMVFQNYALYPHLSVYDNIAFGLKIRKIKKSIIEKKVNEVASVLGLTSYLQRKPKDLSGGQRQRVALGRAIVRDAGIFLMDEPLSNLDAKLRVHMRTEIMALHRSLQATTIYVTHDQTEAMTMADRIVVLNEGYIQQIGTPKEIYSKPNNTFVASFMGSPPINLLAGILEDNKLKLMDGLVVCPTMDDTAIKRSVVIGIRPEAIRITEKSELKMRVQFTEILGADIHLHGLVGKEKFVVRIPADHSLDLKDELYLEIDKENIHLFDAETKQRYLEEGEF